MSDTRATVAADDLRPRRPSSRIDMGLIVLAVIAGGVALTAPLWWRLDVGYTAIFLLNIVAGGAMLAGGVIATRWRAGRSLGRLLLVAATLFFAFYIGLGEADLAYTVGLFIEGAWLPIATHAVVAFPDGRLRTTLERMIVAVAYGWTAGIRLLFPLFDPVDAGCVPCPRNLLLIRREPDLPGFIFAGDSVIGVVLAMAVLVVLVRRWIRATRPERVVLSPLFVAVGANVAAIAGFAVVYALFRAGVLSEDASQGASLVSRAALPLIPIGMGVGIFRGVRARSAVANLLVKIGKGGRPDELERDVGWALADPTARLVSRDPQTNAYVDASGRPVPTSDGRAVATVLRSGRGEVALLHDRWLADEMPDLVESVVSAVRLALDNSSITEARLRAGVSAGLVERLLSGGARVGDTERRMISVVMSDIRGYSSIAEREDPRRLATQLQEHRVAMSSAVSAEGGTVMQYVGDSVFAVFGAPAELDDHAARAIRAAMRMQRDQRRMNEHWRLRGLTPFAMGISVTTGEVAAALLGSADHVEYSVVGDIVNLAQRIQAWAADGEIVVSHAAYEAVDPPPQAVALEPRTVKGRSGVVRAWRISED